MHERQWSGLVAPTADEVAQAAAQSLVADLHTILQQQTTAQVVLSTGETPLRTYAALQQQHRQALPWSRVRLCQMDEYVGIADDDPRRFSSFLLQHLVRPLGMQFRPLRGDETDAQMRVYEHDMEEAGGLDLILYGVGVNGHLGFNEPGSSFVAPSRRVSLHPSTRARIDTQAGPAPTAAVTLGLAVLNAARRVRVMALGAAKRRALTEGLMRPPSEALPLSSVQGHPDVRFFFDAPACPEGLRLHP